MGGYMERYENIVKIEEIRRLTDNNEYIKALRILDTMDTGRIKTLTDLSIIADVYMQNGRYDEAMAVLTKIYGKTKTRRVLYQLVDLSIKRGSIKEAEDYLQRYIKAAPQDSSRFIFRYCIDKLNGEPYEALIASLEQLKEYEYYEKWAYELAKLYHKAGMKDNCVRECSDIILWFGEGIYVEKAKLLKGYYVGEINPLHMLKAKEKKEAEKKMGLYKTKDYSSMRSRIDQFLAKEEASKEDGIPAGKEQEVPDEVREDNNSGMTEQNSFPADIREVVPEEAREIEQNKDPELEEYFKNIAMKLKKEVAAGSETTSDEETAPDNGISRVTDERMQEIGQAPENKAYVNSGKESEQEMEPPGNETSGQETKIQLREEISPEIQQESRVSEQETKQGPEYNSRTDNDFEETETVIQTTGDMEDISLHNKKQHLSDRLVSAFSEAGMNYEKDFGYFIRIDSCRIQIEACLENVLSDYTKNNHMIITGRRKSGKTTLAKKISKALYELNWINANRAAKISAVKLNGTSPEKKKDKLVNSCLIIEEAGSLEQSTAEQLLSLIRDLSRNIFVILEDEEYNIKKLLKKNPKLKEVFTSRIHLPDYTPEDILGFAFTYIQNYDYEFTGDARTAFEEGAKKILNSVTEEEQLEAVMELARNAKLSADERYKTLLSDIIRERDLNSEDFLYIKKEDFLSEDLMNG